MARGEPRVITLDAVRRAVRSHRPQPADAPDARPAAVALVLLSQPQGLEILLIRRAERADDPWSGQIAFPGGREEAADEDLLTTAVRETREETGVDLSAAERLGALDDLYPRTPTLPPVVVRPFVFVLHARPSLVPSDEVQRAFWVPLAQLTDPAARRDVTLTVRGTQRTFPAYLVGKDVIWGMTERILTPLLDRVTSL
ncbi:MAG TPA: CoA pyrophosphatase [Gemmatimonadales bacterium]|nr:CoA pyrophosphatase [Gemmatimonadales bacterium]